MTVAAVPGLEWQWPRPAEAVSAARALGAMRRGGRLAAAQISLPWLDVDMPALFPAPGWQAARTLADEAVAGRHGEVCDRRGGGFLFGTPRRVSGTTNTAGHRTGPLGDVHVQTWENPANTAAVLDKAARVSGGPRREAGALADLAYVRHADDLAAVRAEVEARIGARAAVAYVQADVCRADLLVGIEASGGHPIRGFA